MRSKFVSLSLIPISGNLFSQDRGFPNVLSASMWHVKQYRFCNYLNQNVLRQKTCTEIHEFVAFSPRVLELKLFFH